MREEIKKPKHTEAPKSDPTRKIIVGLFALIPTIFCILPVIWVYPMLVFNRWLSSGDSKIFWVILGVLWVAVLILLIRLAANRERRFSAIGWYFLLTMASSLLLFVISGGGLITGDTPLGSVVWEGERYNLIIDSNLDIGTHYQVYRCNRFQLNCTVFTFDYFDPQEQNGMVIQPLGDKIALVVNREIILTVDSR